MPRYTPDRHPGPLIEWKIILGSTDDDGGAVGDPSEVGGITYHDGVWAFRDAVGVFNPRSAGGAPGGSTGQLQYNNAGAFGGASQLYWDEANSRLGIGTSSPQGVLHIVDSFFYLQCVTNSTANKRLYRWDTNQDYMICQAANDAYGWVRDLICVKHDGSVGIGTNTVNAGNRFAVEGAAAIGSTYYSSAGAPSNGLIVEGNTGIGTSSPSCRLDIESSASTTGIEINNTATDGDPYLSFQLSGTQKYTMGVDDGDADKFKLASHYNWSTVYMTIEPVNGNVGIGVDPTYRLHVAAAATAIYGSSTSDMGVVGATSSTDGDPGVLGIANGSTGVATGVYGKQNGTAATSIGYGVFGEAQANFDGMCGVYGYASHATPASIGVFGKSNSTSVNAIGVKGESSNGFGGYFVGKGYFSGSVGMGTSPGSEALLVSSSGFAVHGVTTSTSASYWGVCGEATGVTGATYGVLGKNSSASANAIAVLGQALDTGSAGTFGVYGSSASTGGCGVRGHATATGAGTTYGVQGIADASTYGRGVYGEANGSGGIGVYGKTTNAGGRGVYGYCNTSGYGVYGECPTGTPVYGLLTGTTGFTYAIYGRCSGSTGAHGAVLGYNSSTTDSSKGIYGLHDGASGVVYGVYGYAQTSTSGVGVYGWGKDKGVYGVTDTAYGVAGYSSGASGTGVFGQSGGASGKGVHGYNSSSGTAVYCQAGTGYAIDIRGDTASTPARGAVHFHPQSAQPSSAAIGDMYIDSTGVLWIYQSAGWKSVRMN